MLGRAFNSLLSGRRLGTTVKWARAHRCPCAAVDGEADSKCAVCLGKGRYYDEWSDQFRAGFLGQDSRSLVNMMKEMGGGTVGDGVILISENMPCYEDIGMFDRVQVVDSTDTLEWVLVPGMGVRLPPTAEPLSAVVRSVDGASVQDAPFPIPGEDGRISVAVATTIQFRVARLYEVSRELPKVRGFQDGRQPKRLALVRVDWTVR